LERNHCKPVIRAMANRCLSQCGCIDQTIQESPINFQTFWILILIGGGAEMISGIIHAFAF